MLIYWKYCWVFCNQCTRLAVTINWERPLKKKKTSLLPLCLWYPCETTLTPRILTVNNIWTLHPYDRNHILLSVNKKLLKITWIQRHLYGFKNHISLSANTGGKIYYVCFLTILKLINLSKGSLVNDAYTIIYDYFTNQK